MRRLRHLAPLLCLLAACGSGANEAPRWLSLAQGFEPRPLVEIARGWELAAGTELLEEADGSLWLSRRLGRDDWSAGDRPGSWRAALPARHGFAGDGASRLRCEERALEAATVKTTMRPGLWLVIEDGLYVSLAPDEDPPAEAHYDLRLDHGRAEEGRWRVRTPTHCGDGVPVYAGEREELELTIPPRAALRFHAGLGANASTEAGSGAVTLTFRVRLDGSVLWEGVPRAGAAVTVELPAKGRERAKLTLEVEGGDGLGVFFAPTLGPAHVGTYRERPWGADRPDLVLFIADTFRADNLAAYGGRPDLTPNLNRFAAASRRFLEARSTAAWTLPSISSVLTGLFPGQHGASEEHLSLPRSLRTISKVFGEFGYRTAAVTDSGFFAPAFGLDQGFELFVENRIHRWNLDKTIDQALDWLDADDGRPVLLVVHTYRVHGPFRQGPDEDQSAFDAFMARGLADLEADPERGPESSRELLLERIDEWVGLYEDGVRDLDAKFPRLWDALTARGLLDTGALLFLGDHGQAHGENEDVAHGGRLWDTKLRIPLLVHGGGLAPGDERAVVSLVDVAPTLARLAGVPADPSWAGVPLLDVPAGRPAFAFRIESRPGGKNELVVLAGDKKLFTPPDAERLRAGEVLHAFDLASDPGELHDLRDEADWPAQMAREAADLAERFLTRAAARSEADVDLELQRRLADIGYTGN